MMVAGIYLTPDYYVATSSEETYGTITAEAIACGANVIIHKTPQMKNN